MHGYRDDERGEAKVFVLCVLGSCYCKDDEMLLAACACVANGQAPIMNRSGGEVHAFWWGGVAGRQCRYFLPAVLAALLQLLLLRQVTTALHLPALLRSYLPSM